VPNGAKRPILLRLLPGRTPRWMASVRLRRGMGNLLGPDVGKTDPRKPDVDTATLGSTCGDCGKQLDRVQVGMQRLRHAVTVRQERGAIEGDDRCAVPGFPD
jgi:hypothetical protein